MTSHPAEEYRFSAEDLGRVSRQVYVGGPFIMRKMMHYRIQICPFERLISHVSPGASILDIGCGSGLFLALVAATVPKVVGTGFDSSHLAIESAVQMAEQVKRLGMNDQLKFIRLGVDEPWPSGRFDVVSLIDVMHHISPANQKEVFQRATTSLKLDGVLLYKDMADRPAFHAVMNRLHDLVLARQWIHYVPIRQVDEWAAERGLTPSHAETMSRLYYRHEFRVYRQAA